MTHEIFYTIILVWCAIAILSFFALLFIPAPYGRHNTKEWRYSINGAIGWVLLEFPSAIAFLFFYLAADDPTDFFSLFFLLLWEAHYFHRSFIFALRRKEAAKPMALVIVISGIIFNLINGSLNGYWLYFISPGYPKSWLYNPQFIIGVALFFIGFGINFVADEQLLKLRRAGGYRYGIPNGLLYRYISCPNYFGEIIEWLGFALATGSPAAYAFVLWTCANLIPRALSHHQWYKKQFLDYPEERKAVIPFIL